MRKKKCLFQLYAKTQAFETLVSLSLLRFRYHYHWFISVTSWSSLFDTFTDELRLLLVCQSKETMLKIFLIHRYNNFLYQFQLSITCMKNNIQIYLEKRKIHWYSFIHYIQYVLKICIQFRKVSFMEIKIVYFCYVLKH